MFDSVGDKPNRRLLICDVTGWVATIVDQDVIGVRPASTYELIRLWNRAGANPTRMRRCLAREADPKARACLLRLLIEQGGQSVEVCFADGRSARVTGHAVDRVMTRMNAATPESAIALLRRTARRATPSRLPKLIELIKSRANVAPTDFYKTRDGWEFTVCEGQLVSVYFRDSSWRGRRAENHAAYGS